MTNELRTTVAYGIFKTFLYMAWSLSESTTVPGLWPMYKWGDRYLRGLGVALIGNTWEFAFYFVSRTPSGVTSRQRLLCRCLPLYKTIHLRMETIQISRWSRRTCSNIYCFTKYKFCYYLHYCIWCRRKYIV